MPLVSKSTTRAYGAPQTEEEKSFITSLVAESQSVHEQELVSQGNEIRRVSETASLSQFTCSTIVSATTISKACNRKSRHSRPRSLAT